jgi:hypothetical protein
VNGTLAVLVPPDTSDDEKGASDDGKEFEQEIKRDDDKSKTKRRSREPRSKAHSHSKYNDQFC